MPAFIEPNPGTSGTQLAERLAELGATDIEETVPGIWSANITAAAVRSLEDIAGVTFMDKKSMLQRR